MRGKALQGLGHLGRECIGKRSEHKLDCALCASTSNFLWSNRGHDVPPMHADLFSCCGDRSREDLRRHNPPGGLLLACFQRAQRDSRWA